MSVNRRAHEQTLAVRMCFARYLRSASARKPVFAV
jgi:hypothetical protein